MFLLESDRLILRKFQYEDWQDLYDYLSQEEVVKYEPYNVFTEDECKDEVMKRAEHESFFAICLKENNKVIGNIYFHQKKPKDFMTWELGYIINPKYWGQGYARESCIKIMEYGFFRMNVRRIVAMCNPENESSWRLLERLKMRREGHLIKNIFFKRDDLGKPIWVDTYEYAILLEEWGNNEL